MTELSRRAVLSTTGRAAAASVATLSLGGLSLAATDPIADAELRRLYTEYQELDRQSTAAWEGDREDRDALERRVLGGKTINELAEERRREGGGRTLTAKQQAAWTRAFNERPRPDKYDEACALSKRVRAVIRHIRAVPAEGLFGVAVKLVVLTEHWQGEHVEENVRYALEDINRLTGTDFKLAERSLGEYLDQWGGKGLLDDEDEAEGDADV